MNKTRLMILLAASLQICAAADVTGNWLASEQQADGTSRRTYLNLKQEGSQITGTGRLGYSYFDIKQSTSNGPDTYSLTVNSGRPNAADIRIDIKLVGDELQIETRRRPNAPLTHLVAHRVAAGEGAKPARSPYQNSTKFLITVSRRRRQWVGIAGTNLPVRSTTRAYAPRLMRWWPAA